MLKITFKITICCSPHEGVKYQLTVNTICSISLNKFVPVLASKTRIGRTQVWSYRVECKFMLYVDWETENIWERKCVCQHVEASPLLNVLLPLVRCRPFTFDFTLSFLHLPCYTPLVPLDVQTPRKAVSFSINQLYFDPFCVPLKVRVWVLRLGWFWVILPTVFCLLSPTIFSDSTSNLSEATLPTNIDWKLCRPPQTQTHSGSCQQSFISLL